MTKTNMSAATSAASPVSTGLVAPCKIFNAEEFAAKLAGYVADVIAAHSKESVATNSFNFNTYVYGLKGALKSHGIIGNHHELFYVHFVLPLQAHYGSAYVLNCFAIEACNELLRAYKSVTKDIEKSDTLHYAEGVTAFVGQHLVNDKFVVPRFLRYLYKTVFYAEKYGDDYFRMMVGLLHKLDASTVPEVRAAVMIAVAQLTAGVNNDQINHDEGDAKLLRELAPKYLSVAMCQLGRMAVDNCRAACHGMLLGLATSDDLEGSIEAVRMWFERNAAQCPDESVDHIVLYRMLKMLVPTNAAVTVLTSDHPQLTAALNMPAVIQVWRVVRQTKLSTPFLQCLCKGVVQTLGTFHRVELEECITDMLLELGRCAINKADPEFVQTIKTWLGAREGESAANLRGILG